METEGLLPHGPTLSQMNPVYILTRCLISTLILFSLICYGHVERMDPTRLPKIMIYRKLEGREKRGRPRRTWKDGLYTAMNARDLRMGEWNNRGQWNMKVGRRLQTF